MCVRVCACVCVMLKLNYAFRHSVRNAAPSIMHVNFAVHMATQGDQLQWTVSSIHHGRIHMTCTLVENTHS